MGNPKLVRVGIVGAGGIARHHHMPSLCRCEKVGIVAACDVSDAALKEMKEQHGIKRLCHDYDELLQMDDLDIIDICTSNDMHYPIAMGAIERGFDVYCEKPLALTYKRAKEMHRAAKARGTKTGVNFSHRRVPAVQLAKEILDSGALGRIHYISALFAAGWTDFADRPGTWRNDRARAGFGGLGDMGSHLIDMTTWLLGSEITSVAAQMNTIVPERVFQESGQRAKVTTEDQGMLLVRYANDAMGYICGSYVFTGRGFDQRIEIYGRDGGLIYDRQHPYELQVHLPPEYLKRYVTLRQGGTKDTSYATILVPERLQGLIPGEPNTQRTVLMDYIDAYRVKGAFSFSPGFYEGMKVQEVLEASLRAERDRCWVSLPL